MSNVTIYTIILYGARTVQRYNGKKTVIISAPVSWTVPRGLATTRENYVPVHRMVIKHPVFFPPFFFLLFFTRLYPELIIRACTYTILSCTPLVCPDNNMRFQELAGTAAKTVSRTLYGLLNIRSKLIINVQKKKYKIPTVYLYELFSYLFEVNMSTESPFAPALIPKEQVKNDHICTN